MALTIKLLKGMGIDEEKIEAIISAHTETTDGLKAERDRYKKQAEQVPDLQKKLEEAELAAKGDSDWQTKYDEEHKAFEEYKEQVTSEKKAADKASAYRKQVLEKAGIASQYVDDVMGVTKLDGIEVDDDGNIKDADKLVEAAKAKWSSFVTRTKTVTERHDNPPQGSGEAEGGDPEVARRMQMRYEQRYGKASEPKE